MYLIALIIVLVVTITTYFLHNYTPLNAIQASCILGVLLGIVIQLDSSIFFVQNEVFYWAYGGTFLGMTSKKLLGIGGLILSSITLTVVLCCVFKYTAFLGGSLGAWACICALWGIKGQLYVRKKNKIFILSKQDKPGR